jgi:GTP-binding protein EngB required for normal cell division
MAYHTQFKYEVDEHTKNEKMTWHIGAELRKVTQELTAIGAKLQQVLDDKLAPIVGEAIEAVNKQHSRIAILGQPRTGKTSFVNALIQRSNFLPIDNKPWTSVVSRLHFAVAGKPRNGALFAFFEQDEWQRLALEDSKLKELVSRLCPKENQEPQFVDPRHVTEARLSQYYQRLFGKDRLHDVVTRDVIDCYIRLSQAVDEPLTELMPGRYSDITKTADLFFDAAPFACPATVIDTPGMNEPPRLRDEISLQSVEDADVYVVIMSALKQPNSSDLSLLRKLICTGQNRVAIFLNKIDGISGIDNGEHVLISGVRQTLEKEFPGVEIPVITGSTLWANAALDLSQGDLERIWRPELIAYAHSIGALEPNEPTALTGHRAISRERLSDVLYACSGVPAMISAISRLMLHGSAGYWLNQLGTTLLAAAENMTDAARKEAEALNTLLSIGGDKPSLPPPPASAAPPKPVSSQKLTRLNQAVHSVKNYLTTAEEWLRQETVLTIDSLRISLSEDVKSFAAHQGTMVPPMWLREKPIQPWVCNLRPMLDRMNEQLLRSFWETGNLLIDAQRQAAPELKRIVSEASQDLTPPPAPASLLNFSLKPSFSPPEITIIFDLKDENWLDVQSAEAATLRIEKILTARLGVVVNELVAAASDELQAYVATRIKKFFMRYLDVVEKAAVGETKRVLRMNEGVLSSGRKAPPDTAPDPNVKLRRARERLAEGEDLIRRLKECIKLQEQPVQ